MSTSWFVEHNGKPVGPMSSSQLKQLAASSKINPQTKVRMGESGEWSRASKVKGLFDQLVTTKPETVVATRSTHSVTAPIQQNSPPPAVPANKPCPFCGESIALTAIKCRHCNEFLDGRPKESSVVQQPIMQHAPQPVVNVTQMVSNNTNVGYYGPRKSKMVAVLLAFFLGGLGLQHFYMGRTMRGLLYLLFCWTFIPAILGLLESVYYLLMSDASFQSRCR